jgi:hypothetical protein
VNTRVNSICCAICCATDRRIATRDHRRFPIIISPDYSGNEVARFSDRNAASPSEFIDFITARAKAAPKFLPPTPHPRRDLFLGGESTDRRSFDYELEIREKEEKRHSRNSARSGGILGIPAARSDLQAPFSVYNKRRFHFRQKLDPRRRSISAADVSISAPRGAPPPRRPLSFSIQSRAPSPAASRSLFLPRRRRRRRRRCGAIGIADARSDLFPIP